MFVSRGREKLINAIIYFLCETMHSHTLKLFKFLNFSDLEHFRQTGRTMFALDYRALPKGPVLTLLPEEIKRGGNLDEKAAIQFFEVRDDIANDLQRRDRKAKAVFNNKNFSKRELKILERAASLVQQSSKKRRSSFYSRPPAGR